MCADKKTIAVIFGGRSPEYGVSLQSAHAVLTHIDREKYEVIPLGITREGEWFWFKGDIDLLPEDQWRQDALCVPVAVSQSPKLHGLLVLGKGNIQEIPLDGAFPVLHGQNGEDGTVQGTLELAGIPVVGCGLLASAVCMDKDMAHRLAKEAGVRVPASFLLNREDADIRAAGLGEKLGYPLFVKPLKAGSSFGVSRVEKPEELSDALSKAFVYDSQAVMEEGIDGFEVGCAVMGDRDLTVGAVDEIELSEGFFDFTEKYTLKTSKIHVPARISEKKAREVQETAKRLYRALGCSGFARVDMFLDGNGKIVFNEINTIPGCTAHSRYPSMMAQIGITFEDLIGRLLEQAVPSGENAFEEGQAISNESRRQEEQTVCGSGRRPGQEAVK